MVDGALGAAASGDGAHAPLPAQSDQKLRVFLSYSRADLAFADQLDAALDAYGFDCTLDRQGISGGEDWKTRLESMLREADTVVFALSPDSAKSEVCAWEVETAASFGKRLVPIVCRPLDSQPAPRRLADLNYIFFYPEPKSPGSGFGGGLARLVAALNTDLDWLREHTRYLQRATEWHRGGRIANRMLSGSDITEAKAWIARRPKGAPEPTSLHLDYIRASEQEETDRNNAERQRLEAMAAAQQERQKALRAAEEAHAQRVAEQRRRERLQTTLMAGALAVAVVFAAIGFYSWTLWQRAEVASGVAQEQTVIARKQTVVAEEAGRQLAARVDELKAANLRLSRKMSLRVAPFGDRIQTVRDSWYAIATDLTGAVATVFDRRDRPYGTGFIIRAGALYDGWGDDTVFVTASFVLDGITRSRDMSAIAARFHGSSRSDEQIAFSEVRWESRTNPPEGASISILDIKGELPFGAKRIENVQPVPLEELADVALNDGSAVARIAGDDLASARLKALATIGNPVAEAGFSLIISRLVGVKNDTRSSSNRVLLYTYATGGGASGSPVFDVESGELIAVHLMGMRQTNLGGGISADSLVAAIKANPQAR